MLSAKSTKMTLWPRATLGLNPGKNYDREASRLLPAPPYQVLLVFLMPENAWGLGNTLLLTLDFPWIL